MDQQRTKRALQAVTEPSLTSTAYDTAWVAYVRSAEDPRRPRFPAALDWVLERQHADGSWGGDVRYEHDRMISTLSALRPLLRFRELLRSVEPTIERAQRYLWQHAHALAKEPIELVGFELLLPMLVQDVGSHIALPSYLNAYDVQRAHKLAMLAKQMIYSPNITIVHSLEFLGTGVDLIRLVASQNQNGSIGNSPAATAWLLDLVDNENAAHYLQSCLSFDGGASVTVLHPCKMFDLLWSAYHGFLGGVPATQALPRTSHANIRSMLEKLDGVSLDDSFPIADADDTAVALLLLHESGESVPWEVLDSFRHPEGYYASFPYERHPSSGVNVHVLDALRRAPLTEARRRDMSRIIGFLTETRVHETYWFDKWHISPYYATGHSILVLHDLVGDQGDQARRLASTALDWIRHTQREDGSWGFYDGVGTAEETAYCLLALKGARTLARDVDPELVKRGVGYLERCTKGPLPQLWIDKCLYLPPNIVQSAIDSALRSNPFVA